MRRRLPRGVMALLVPCLLTAATCSPSNAGDDGIPDPPGTTTTTQPRVTAPPESIADGPLQRGSFDTLIPRPTSVTPAEGEFRFGVDTAIILDASEVGATPAQLLHDYLQVPTGLDVQVLAPDAERPEEPAITFVVDTNLGLGAEGYELRIRPDGVDVVAGTTTGLGWAVQTIRQLLPAQIEFSTVVPGEWALPAGTIRDVPRYAWRGAMLDVARHFFPPAEVERVIDLMALYKMNRLHLHLTDDQGWRIEIEAYPQLTEIGAATQIDGQDGGYYTKDDFVSLVDYAARRGIVVVPEIDVPGHTTAALASIPALNCDGQAPRVLTGHSTGASSLCLGDGATITVEFVSTVIEELAEMTPGPYIHLGGDESFGTDPGYYQWFMSWAAEEVRAHGKRPIGWDEIGTAIIGPSTLVQYWDSVDNLRAGVAQGAQVVMSPAPRAYLDMKYDVTTALGLTWAGFVDTRTAYEWDPATFVPDIAPEAVLGVEAPLWSETVVTLQDVETMLLPRLPGYAEIGWSAPEARSWDEYRLRLATHGARWSASGRTFTRDPVVPWTE